MPLTCERTVSGETVSVAAISSVLLASQRRSSTCHCRAVRGPPTGLRCSPDEVSARSCSTSRIAKLRGMAASPLNAPTIARAIDIGCKSLGRNPAAPTRNPRTPRLSLSALVRRITTTPGFRTRNVPRRGNRVQTRHSDVDDDQVWLVKASELDGLRPVEGLRDDDDAGASQRAAQRAARRTPVVGDDRAPRGSLLTEALHRTNATESRKLSSQTSASSPRSRRHHVVRRGRYLRRRGDLQRVGPHATQQARRCQHVKAFTAQLRRDRVPAGRVRSGSVDENDR